MLKCNGIFSSGGLPETCVMLSSEPSANDVFPSPFNINYSTQVSFSEERKCCRTMVCPFWMSCFLLSECYLFEWSRDANVRLCSDYCAGTYCPCDCVWTCLGSCLASF